MLIATWQKAIHLWDNVEVAHNQAPPVLFEELAMGDVSLYVKGQSGSPVQGAALLAAYPDGRYLTGQTDTDGQFRVHLYRDDQPMKVLVAAEGYLPFCRVFPGLSDTVLIELEPSKDGRRAALFTRSAGYIPGIEGRLNPHKDGYVYGDNLAIDGRLATPAVHFELGEPLHLIDVFGVETTIRFLIVEGQFSLIEYSEPKAYSGE